MSNVIPFNYNDNEVRTIQDENGNTWFVAKDIAKTLGYVDTTQAVRKHCKNARQVGGVDSTPLDPQTKIIPEPDVYRLIAKSSLPAAEAFEAWIFEEVLPTIRRTGSYQTSDATPKSLAPAAKEFHAAIRLCKYMGLDKNQAILSANRAVKEITGTDCMAVMQITHLESDIQDQHVTPTDIGVQVGGVSGRKANQLLEGLGYQESFRDGKNKLKWKPTDKGKAHAIFKDTGKKHSDGTPVVQLFWKESIIGVLQHEVANA
tara:strand:- start:879 stop:1658 length:780 start_codon:yes stop_codon:yes gene_type:complete